MRLGISSDADVTAATAQLLEACRRRGLHGVELRLAAGTERADLLATAVEELQPAPPPGVMGLLCSIAEGPRFAARAAALGVPLVLDGAGRRPDEAARVRSLVHQVGRTLPEGVSALPLMRGPAADWIDAVADVDFAWQLDAAVADPAGDAALILRTGRLAYVRMVGGGPETALQDGRGIGAALRQFALAGYAGPLIVTPSSARYRVAWSVWLGRRGGWGCGSKAGNSEAPVQTVTLTRMGS